MYKNLTRVRRSKVKVTRDKTTKQVGGFLRPDCAPSSKCPQFRMPLSFERSTMPRHRFNCNIPASVVQLQQYHCRNRHRDKLQNVSPPSVLFEASLNFFYNTQETKTQKMMDQNVEIRIVIFGNFLKFSKRRRTTHGPSAADLDHYGRGKTRSQ